jgi:hypothetical protein
MINLGYMALGLTRPRPATGDIRQWSVSCVPEGIERGVSLVLGMAAAAALT